MAKTLFKGIKQVKYSTYTATTAANKAAYLWFVRPDDAADGTVGDIYFGSRHYGKVDEAGYAKIEAALAGFLDNGSKTVKAYVDDIISGLTLECVSESGKPIVAVCQSNGKVTATVGTIDAGNVNIADSGSVITATTVEGALQEIATEIDNMDLQEVGGTGKMITTISEADGVVSATAIDATAANIAVADAGGNFTASTKTVESSLAELAEKAKSQELASADKTITITPSTGGTDVAVNIDEATIVKDGTNGTLSVALQLSGVTPSSSNIKEEYALVDASGVTHGSNIKIYNDSSLQNVELGHIGDLLSGTTAITEESDSASIVHDTGSTEEALNFVYLLNNGKYKLAQVSLEEFLQESEFKDGLQVNNNHEVSVKVDSNSEKVITAYAESGNTSGEVLSVSASGVSVNNIQNAIDAKVAKEIGELDYSGVTSNGQAVVNVTEADGVVTATLGDINDAHVVNSADFTGTTGSGFTSGMTEHAVMQGVMDALDGVAADVLEEVEAGSGITVSTKSAKKQTISAKVEASTAATVAAGHIEIAFNGNGEMYGVMYYDGDDTE